MNQGKIGRICPQASPAWGLIALQFVPKYLAGLPFNETEAKAALASNPGSLPVQDPRTSEDCLFLDVITPQKIFDRGKATSYKKKAPVLVWIHGGGYTAGEKTGSGLYNPTGLLKASQATGSEGFVFVSINYRVRSTAKNPSANNKRNVILLMISDSWVHLDGYQARICKRMGQLMLLCMTSDLPFAGYTITYTCLVAIVRG